MTTQDPNLKAAGELLRRHQSFLVSSHLRVDCDGVASELALAELLTALGKDAHVVNPGPVPRAFRFLPGSERITVVDQGAPGPAALDAAVILDSPDWGRIGTVASLLPRGLPVLNIDHHPDNAFFGTVNLVDPQASSACELLWRVIGANDFPLSSGMATNLYAGILSDTGRFCFSNTSAEALGAAAELVRAGADAVAVGVHLYEHFPEGLLRLWADVVATLELLVDGRVAVGFVTRDMLRRRGVSQEDTQDFAEIPRMLASVQVGVLLREMSDGMVSVSLRSRGSVNVSAMAARLGGGGHHHAAGTVLAGPAARVREQVLAVVTEALAAGVSADGGGEAKE
jgi:phosphoesterase RecJ-like protein